VTETAAIERYRVPGTAEAFGVPVLLRLYTYLLPGRSNGLLGSKAAHPQSKSIDYGHPQRICLRRRRCQMGIEVFVPGPAEEVLVL
jgi:hypothetical protein